MIYIIAALAKNRVIGDKGKIPWDLPEDRDYFKSRTMGHIIVMGRRTYEEIGFPLPGRKTYLISSVMKEEGENITTVKSLSEVIAKVRELELATGKKEDIFICGGARLYQEALPLAGGLYLTELEAEVKGDAFFPEVDKRVFQEVNRNKREGYDFVEYRRR